MFGTVIEMVAHVQNEDRVREAQTMIATQMPRVRPTDGARRTPRERVATALVALAARLSPAMAQTPHELRAASR